MLFDMGSKSCRLTGDKVEVKSPILGCIIEHCTCSCTGDPEENQQGPSTPKDPGPEVPKGASDKKKKRKKATVKGVIPN